MANNQSIKNYYNSRINDFRKKVSRGIIPLETFLRKSLILEL